MSASMNIARPYAKALFYSAKDDGTLSLWLTILECLTLAVESNAKMLISSKSLKADNIIEILSAVVYKYCNLEDDERQKLQSLLTLLIANKRLAVIKEIYRTYQILYFEETRMVTALVKSADVLSIQQQNSLKQALAKKLQKEVILDIHEDKSLLGGLMIHIDDMVIDWSLRGKLQALREVFL